MITDNPTREPRVLPRHVEATGEPVDRSPILARRLLGAELRTRRDMAHASVVAAAKVLGCSTAKISRLENGKGIPYPRDIRDLLAFYNVSDSSYTQKLLQLADQGQASAWWDDYDNILKPDSSLEMLIGLEADASETYFYAKNLLPGLLQTPDYIRGVYAGIFPHEPKSFVDQLVKLRIRRQEVLRREPKPLIETVILDEETLHRVIGGTEVMLAQLQVIENEIERSLTGGSSQFNISILPFSAGAHGGLDGPFRIFLFAEEPDQNTLFFEGKNGTSFVEGEAIIRTHLGIFDSIDKKSIRGPEAIALIREVAAKIEAKT
jgi:transcriptional regulator with XRE-family HTH domain